MFQSSSFIDMKPEFVLFPHVLENYNTIKNLKFQ